MRHFSGEFEGIRLLMMDELDLIAGGEGEDTDDVPPPPPEEPEIVVTGRRITSAPVPGFTGPIIIDLPPDPDPEQPDDFDVIDGCTTMRNELNEALNNLQAGSSAAAAIIAAARQSGLDIKLIREDTTSARDSYNSSTGVLSWDPFSAAYGQNYNGSTYTLTPTMSLAHELIHWANPNLTEIEVIAVSNEIAKQMNQTFGTTYDTSRDRHYGEGRFNVNDTDSAAAGTRPACQ